MSNPVDSIRHPSLRAALLAAQARAAVFDEDYKEGARLSMQAVAAMASFPLVEQALRIHLLCSDYKGAKEVLSSPWEPEPPLTREVLLACVAGLEQGEPPSGPARVYLHWPPRQPLEALYLGLLLHAEGRRGEAKAALERFLHPDAEQWGRELAERVALSGETESCRMCLGHPATTFVGYGAVCRRCEELLHDEDAMCRLWSAPTPEFVQWMRNVTEEADCEQIKELERRLESPQPFATPAAAEPSHFLPQLADDALLDRLDEGALKVWHQAEELAGKDHCDFVSVRHLGLALAKGWRLSSEASRLLAHALPLDPRGQCDLMSDDTSWLLQLAAWMSKPLEIEVTQLWSAYSLEVEGNEMGAGWFRYPYRVADPEQVRLWKLLLKARPRSLVLRLLLGSSYPLLPVPEWDAWLEHEEWMLTHHPGMERRAFDLTDPVIFRRYLNVCLPALALHQDQPGILYNAARNWGLDDTLARDLTDHARTLDPGNPRWCMPRRPDGDKEDLNAKRLACEVVNAMEPESSSERPLSLAVPLMEAAFRAGDFDRVYDVGAYVVDALSVASLPEADLVWHQCHTLMGLVCLRRTDTARSIEHLELSVRELSGRTPSMRLATELMDKGATEAVLDYLSRWQSSEAESWAASIRNGQPPLFPSPDSQLSV